jgi:hypothetical protein
MMLFVYTAGINRQQIFIELEHQSKRGGMITRRWKIRFVRANNRVHAMTRASSTSWKTLPPPGQRAPLGFAAAGQAPLPPARASRDPKQPKTALSRCKMAA